MRNQVQEGRTLTLPAPADVVSGQLVFIGNIFGVAAGDAESGGDVDLACGGVFTLPKVTADVLSVGEHVYWHTDKAGEHSTAGALIGVAVEAAGNGATSVKVRLNPSF